MLTHDLYQGPNPGHLALAKLEEEGCIVTRHEMHKGLPVKVLHIIFCRAWSLDVTSEQNLLVCISKNLRTVRTA